MVLRDGVVCLKRTVIVGNFILWFLGICMLAYSLWMFFDSGNPRTAENLDQNLLLVKDLSPYYTGVFLLMGASIIMMAIGFLGWLGAYRESPNMLLAYAGIVVVVTSGQVAAGVIVISNQDKILAGLGSGITNFIQIKYGDPTYYRETQLLDYLQQRFNCCGNATYEDWRSSSWVAANEQRLMQYLVPGSCCFGTVSSGTTCSVSSVIGGLNPYLFKTGCGTKLINIFNVNINVITGLGISLACIEFVAAALSVFLCVRLHREEKRLY